MTTTPIKASMPKARRRRVASGAVIVSTRDTRWLMNCRAATPTKTIPETSNALTMTTRPWLVSNAPRSSWNIWMSPVTTVMTSAGLAMRENPRTA